LSETGKCQDVIEIARKQTGNNSTSRGNGTSDTGTTNPSQILPQIRDKSFTQNLDKSSNHHHATETEEILASAPSKNDEFLVNKDIPISQDYSLSQIQTIVKQCPDITDSIKNAIKALLDSLTNP